MKKKNIALFLVSSLLSVLSIACSSNPDPSSSSLPPSGEAYTFSQEISRIAKKNNTDISASELLSSFHLAESDSVTSEKMLLMLLKAFPSLKEASPYYQSYNEYSDYDLYPISNWNNLSKQTQDAITYFKKRSLFFPKKKNNSGEYEFNPNEKASFSDLKTILLRIQGYLGNSPEDDFYSYINHEELFSADSNNRTNLVNTENIVASAKKFIESMRGENKNRIDNFFTSFQNEEQKKIDYSGLKTTIDNIKGANSIGDLTDILVKDFKTSNNSVLAPFLAVATLTNKNAAYLYNPYIYPYSYKESTESVSFLNEILNVLEAIDSSEYLSAFRLFNSTYFDCLKEKIKTDENGNEIIETKCVSDCLTIGNQFSIASLYEEEGYDSNDFLVYYSAEFDALMETLGKASLSSSKAFLLYLYAENYADCLPKESSIDMSEDVSSYYNDFLPFVANEIMDSYCESSQYSADYSALSSLFNDLKITFDVRLNSNTWLSEEAKDKAKKKLKNMEGVFLNQCTDGTTYSFPVHDYKPASLYDNLNLYNFSLLNSIKDKLNENSAEALIYSTNPLENNAFNDVSHNTIYMTLGYLFSKENPDHLQKEYLYADYGFPIAHEITHSFDSAGSCYDENNLFTSDWLGSLNMKTLQEKSERVASFYSEFEEVPNQKENGSIKMDEAVADLGGLSIVTDLVKKEKDFSNKSLFERIANNNLYYVDFMTYYLVLKDDSHPIGGGRVNPLFMNSELFLETYNIQEGDYMYLSPSENVNVW